MNMKELGKKKREEAGVRQAVYDARSPAQQIAELNRRLGGGVGAKKERNRLQGKGK